MYSVIIVEDDPMVAEINRSYVSRHQKLDAVGIFYNSKDALDYLEKNPVDLIVLDYYIPELNGKDFICELRKRGFTTDVIMVTAASDVKTFSELSSYGITDYIVKPFDQKRFTSALNAFVRKKELIDESNNLSQQSLDKMLIRGAQKDAPAMDKGIQSGTLNKIRQYMKENKGVVMTVDEISAGVALSRVTVRRYINYLANIGEVECGISYATGGRPSSHFTWIGD